MEKRGRSITFISKLSEVVIQGVYQPGKLGENDEYCWFVCLNTSSLADIRGKVCVFR